MRLRKRTSPRSCAACNTRKSRVRRIVRLSLAEGSTAVLRHTSISDSGHASRSALREMNTITVDLLLAPKLQSLHERGSGAHIRCSAPAELPPCCLGRGPLWFGKPAGPRDDSANWLAPDSTDLTASRAATSGDDRELMSTTMQFTTFPQLRDWLRMIRDGQPGCRFERLYWLRRNRRTAWSSTLTAVTGGTLMGVGVVMLIAPGPGIAVLVAGAVVIAQRSLTVARFFDRCEARIHPALARLRDWWNALQRDGA